MQWYHFLGMLPTMTHTNYLCVPCPTKKQASWYHWQSTSLNLISSYGDIVVWLCYQPWAHTSHSQIHFLINKRPSRFHQHTFQFACTNHLRIPCHSNKQPLRYYRQFSYPNVMSPMQWYRCMGAFPTMTHTNYSCVPCSTKKQPSWYNQQFTSLDPRSPCNDIAVWLCYRPWAYMNHSHIPCPAKTWPLQCYQQFTLLILLSPCINIVTWLCADHDPIRAVRTSTVPPERASCSPIGSFHIGPQWSYV